MCMEDIRIGRQLDTGYAIVSVPATTLTRVASANPKRVSIAFGGTNTQIYFQPGPIQSASATGFGTINQEGPMVLRIEDLGQAIIQEWYAWSPVGANSVAVVENSLEKQ